jgi:hypothetical protein
MTMEELAKLLEVELTATPSEACTGGGCGNKHTHITC